MARQLAFDLPVREAHGREDFFVAPSNALALRVLDDPAGWPQGKLVLTGPPGSGKTHLAQLWAGARGAVVVDAARLRAGAVPDLAAAGAIAVEDAHAMAGQAEAETALFHLHNLLAARAGLLLVTARQPAPDWGLRLPDLASRMQAAAVARIDAPDDALLGAVILKQFADRQIAVSPQVLRYLLARMERSLSAAREIVIALDALALARGGPVTRALAAEVLDSHGPQGA